MKHGTEVHDQELDQSDFEILSPLSETIMEQPLAKIAHLVDQEQETTVFLVVFTSTSIVSLFSGLEQHYHKFLSKCVVNLHFMSWQRRTSNCSAHVVLYWGLGTSRTSISETGIGPLSILQ